MNENEVLQKIADTIQTQTEQSENMLRKMDELQSKLRDMTDGTTNPDELSDRLPEAERVREVLSENREHVEENRRIMEELKAAISAKNEDGGQ